MANDLYSELGLAKDASEADIKKAYRKLAAKYHPDKNQGDAAAEAKFKKVSQAFHVLTDGKKRALYDEFGEEGLREGFNPSVARAYRGRVPFGGGGSGGINIEDFVAGGGARGFGDLFGDVFRAARGGARGRDAAGDVHVSFADAIRGTTVTLQVPGVDGEVNVRVPPGAGDGDKLRVAGRGQPGRGGAPPGDLLLTVRVESHPRFTRQGLDLELEFPITALEALQGAKVRVPTPEGPVALSVPAGAQSGQRVRLRARGVRRKDQTGDLYVRFVVALPKLQELPEAEQRTLLQAAQTLASTTDVSQRDAIEL